MSLKPEFRKWMLTGGALLVLLTGLVAWMLRDARQVQEADRRQAAHGQPAAAQVAPPLLSQPGSSKAAGQAAGTTVNPSTETLASAIAAAQAAVTVPTTNVMQSAAAAAAEAERLANYLAEEKERFPYRVRTTDRPLDELVRRDDVLLLRNAFIDLNRLGELQLPAKLTGRGTPGAYIVHARSGVDQRTYALLQSVNAEVVSYLPNNNLLVAMNAAAVESIAQGRPDVVVLNYEPFYKLPDALLAVVLDGEPLPTEWLRVTALPGRGDSVRREITGFGAKVMGQERTPFGDQFIIEPGAADVLTLARLTDVLAVDPHAGRKLANDLARVVLGIATNTFEATEETGGTNYLGLTGTNILVNVNDTGVDVTHPDLLGRVLLDVPSTGIDFDGHGTHVAGTIASSGANSPDLGGEGMIWTGSISNANFRGMAPEATIFAQPISLITGPLLSDSYLQENSARTNALISNNSWGYVGVYDYNFASASYDAAVRDGLPGVPGSQAVTYVFAAGNDGFGNDNGLGGEASSVGAPGTAKNVITVGALETLRRLTNQVISINNGTTNTNRPFLFSTDSSNLVANFSSRGNVGIGLEGDYGRFKPDVVAPGSHVISTRSKDWIDPQNFLYVIPSYFNDLTVRAGATNFNTLFVPDNVTVVRIRAVANANSPVPFPQLSISARPAAGAFVNYGNNDVIIPVTPGFWEYGIGNSTGQDVRYDLQVFQFVSSSDDGYFTELKKLNDQLATYYRFESGTSMASPAVSGLLALVHQFFIEKFGVTNSPAMMKALLINGSRSTDSIYGYATRDFINYQGWGRPDVRNSVPQPLNDFATETNVWPLRFFDQNPEVALATGQEHTRLISVSPDGQFYPLRVTLVWTDPPGNPVAALKLVNDLDLIVTNLTDPANPIVYYGNNFEGGLNFTAAGTNAPPDSVNNVENVFINRPLGTNYSVTVRARRVNVNAVTAHPDQIAQDYALVISLGNSTLTNGFLNVTDIQTTTPPPATQAPFVPVPVTHLDQGVPLERERVAANPPYLATTNGAASQWNFYVVTNTPAQTNAAFTYYAVATFLPANVSRQRTMLEGDLDLYLSRDPGLTNLNPSAIANAFKSVNRGGNEAIEISGSTPGEVFYIGVKSEDQQAVEYGIIGAFSDSPFTDCNAFRCVLRPILPANPSIPDGSPDRPGGLPVIFPGPSEQVIVRRVLATNTLTHESPADLVGTLGHNQDFATFYNHTWPDDNLPVADTRTVVYDDSQEEFLTESGFPRRTTDGPGSLQFFNGTEGQGPWQHFAIDNSLNFTGRVDGITLTVEKMPNLDDFNFSLADGGGYRVATNIGPGAIRLTVTVTNLSGDLNVYVRREVPPSTTQFDKRALLTAPGGVLELTARDVPPLTPGRYHILFLDVVDGIAQPNVQASVRVEYDLLNDGTQNFVSDGDEPLIDDARTNSTINVPEFRQIANIEVGLRIEHERAADLSVFLTSPQGTRVLLAENRGRTNLLGYGEGGPNTETLRRRYLENFEGYRRGTYNVADALGDWIVTADAAAIRYSTNQAYEGFRYLALTPGGTVTNRFETVTNRLYELSYAHRGPDAPGATPVAWYRFDGNALDSVGVNHGVEIGSPGYAAGKVNQALLLDGVNDHVRMPASATLDFGAGIGLTFEAWINPGDVGNARPLAEWNDGTGGGPNAGVGAHLWLSHTDGNVGGPGSLYADLVDDAGNSHVFATEVGLVQAASYQHVALTYNRLSGEAALYLDGTQVAQTNFGNLLLQTSSDLYLGHRPNGASLAGTRFVGGLDEVGLFDRALSGCEIQAIVDADAGGRAAADFSACAPAGGVHVTVNDSLQQFTGSGADWQVASLRFTATDDFTPVRFRGLSSGVNLDFVQLVEVITNAPIVYTRFTDNTNLALLPLKFAQPPYASNSLFLPVSQTGFEPVVPGDFAAVAAVENNWTVTTNSAAVIRDGGLAFAGAQFLALADGRLSLSNLAVTAGTEYNLTVNYRDNSILSWWPGDQTSADVMELNNGTFEQPLYAAGLVRDAFQFTGAKPRRVTFGDASSLNLVGGFTIEGWVNLAALPAGQTAPIIARGDDTGVFPYYLGVQPGGQLVFHITGPGGDSADLIGPALALNTWVHVGAVLDNGTGDMRLFVNGSVLPVASTNITFRPVELLDPLENPEVAIGAHRSPFLGALNGRIDELTVYDRALSASELGAVHRADANGKSGPGELPQPEPLMRVVIDGTETNTVVGSRLWSQETYSITPTGTTLSFDLIGNAQGMLVDSLLITETRSFNHYLAEELLKPFVGENAGGEWSLTVWDNRVGAPVDARLISWTLDMVFANTNAGCIPLTHAVLVTNTIPADSWQYFCVDVPRAASFATNFMSATAPLDMQFSQSGLPDGTYAGDVLFLFNTLTGTATLGTNGLAIIEDGTALPFQGTPRLQPGQRYYLGVYNPNGTAVDVQTAVEFDLIDGITRLTNGVRVVKTIQPGQELDYFQIDISPDAVEVAFEILGPDGDVDLLIQQGPTLPGTNRFDFADAPLDRAVRNKQVVLDTTTVPTLAGTRWYVGAWNQETNAVAYEMRVTEIYGYDPLTVDPAVVTIIPLANGVAYDGTQPAGVSLRTFYRYSVTETNPAVLFEIYDADEDVDLLVARDQLPSILQWDYRSIEGDLTPELVLLRTNTGPADVNADWYIGAPNHGFSPANFKVRAVVTDPTGIIIGGRPPTIEGIIVVVIGSESYLQFSFNSVPGERYQIQYTDDLTAPILWNPITTVLTAPGTYTTFLDAAPMAPVPPAPPIRFYRIQQIP
jgi:subtilisin family serine protease/subtilisin-like proprotein convertase family protein